ncbi:hypothetical protein CPB84DRAFT_1962422 [Gymnopilus junonius]|uniref:Uncharacterized protein n=1 Tax=Gymnopilus junonius TaxID=109634 RepID=A0A9P5TMV8_GYMJU|nr:hypothetical protein CPB84DRAFT_1962422 [Gymnopilus junonius]
MKSIFFTSLSILATFLIVSTSAKPLVDIESQEASPADADKVIKYIQDPNNAGNLNPSCFFSGQTAVQTVIKGKTYTSKKSAESALKDFQASKNCRVIAEVVANAGVSTGVLTDADWKRISKAFADQVAGQVYVLLGKDIRKGSVWETDEKDALKNNAKVTRVEISEIETDGSIKVTGRTKATL